MSSKAKKSAKPAVQSAAKPAKAKPAAKKEAAQREQKNGVTRPGADTLCGKVWSVLDKLHEKGEEATFETVRELAGAKMADATIRTQRQRWREYMGIKREPKKARKSAKRADEKLEAQA